MEKSKEGLYSEINTLRLKEKRHNIIQTSDYFSIIFFIQVLTHSI
jgi:hypothetical protein